MSTEALWPNGPPSDDELEPLYAEVMDAIERGDVAEGLAFKFMVGNLMAVGINEDQAVVTARGTLAFHQVTAEEVVARIFSEWHAKEAMKTSIQEVTSKHGIEIKFEPDTDLSKYRRGLPLKAGEARKLKNGDVVWWRYREHGDYDLGWRADGAHRITWHEEYKDFMTLDDGSSFGGEWQLADLKDPDMCEHFEDGEDFLYHAVFKEEKDD